MMKRVVALHGYGVLAKVMKRDPFLQEGCRTQ
jgi:hypothetical protein